MKYNKSYKSNFNLTLFVNKYYLPYINENIKIK